jgi:hypothetical protein
MYIPPTPRNVQMSWELMPHLPERSHTQELYLTKIDEDTIAGQFEDEL